MKRKRPKRFQQQNFHDQLDQEKNGNEIIREPTHKNFSEIAG
jgi:hypothetical protein